MAVEDTWTLKDGRTHSKRWGRGLRYRVRWKGTQTRSFRTKGEADRHWLRVRTEVAEAPAAAVTVGELLDQWLATKRGLSVRGYRACADAVVHVRALWGLRLADSVHELEVQTWLAGLPSSASQKHKLHQCLAGAMDVAVGRKLIPANPCRGIRLPRQTRREARFLDVAELKRLALAAGHYKNLVLFLGTTGLRIGEAVALNVGDVDAARGRARVRRSKNGKARDVPVPASVLQRLDLNRDREESLFVTERGRRVLKDNWRARVFKPAVAGSQLGKVTIHDLRHTAASLAIAAGADVKAVQNMLGHDSATLTLDWYAHLWDRGLDDVSARMDGLLGDWR